MRFTFSIPESTPRDSRHGGARRIRRIRLVGLVTRRWGNLAQDPVPHFVVDSARAIGGATIGLQNLGAYLLRGLLVDGVRPRVCDTIWLRR